MLFNLGNAISGPPTNKGNKKLPKPPIKAGIQFLFLIGLFLYLHKIAIDKEKVFHV
jgi:hypothetical protein